MKKRTKKVLISLVTTLGISVSTVGCKVAIDKTVPVYYNVNKLNEVTSTASCDNEILRKYRGLSETLVDDSIKNYQPGNMVPQGITTTDDYILTSCYDAKGDNNSVIITLEKETGALVNVCELDNKAHVGGISYDEENNLIWVAASSGNINAYNATKVTEQYQVNAKYKDLFVGKGLKNYKCPWKNSVASLTVYEGKLYVGSFQANSNGLIKVYNIQEEKSENKIYLNYETEFTIPAQVQGISFYNNGENTYLLLSRSFGKYAASVIQIFKYDEDIKDYTDNVPYIYYKAPSMLEQITSDEDTLYSVYESNAEKYQGGKEQVDSLYQFDLPALTKKLK